MSEIKHNLDHEVYLDPKDHKEHINHGILEYTEEDLKTYAADYMQCVLLANLESLAKQGGERRARQITAGAVPYRGRIIPLMPTSPELLFNDLNCSELDVLHLSYQCESNWYDKIKHNVRVS